MVGKGYGEKKDKENRELPGFISYFVSPNIIVSVNDMLYSDIICHYKD